MRPLSLEFTAFGSYPGRHTIDFESLNAKGIFLVTGPTGTGKSTIFDAMVFALYGTLPGGRPESQVRSHHVPDTEKCSVSFEFLVDDVRYRVRRSPSYLRAKKRGEGFTTEAGTCEIERFDGSEWEGLASKAAEVDAICSAAIGLSADQFERVVLLPQGKFQQFLMAGTKDRRSLLQALFGTKIYEDVAVRLKNDAAAAKREIEAEQRAISDRIDHSVGLFSELHQALGVVDDSIDDSDDEIALPTVDELRDRLKNREPAIAELERVHGDAVDDAGSKSATAVLTEQTANRWDRRRRVHEALAELEPRVEEMESRRIAAESSLTFRPLADANQERTRAEDALGDRSAERDGARDELAEVIARLAIEHTVDDEASTLEISAALATTREAHEAAVESFARLDAMEQEVAIVAAEFDAASSAQDRAVGRSSELDADLKRIDSRLDDLRPIADRIAQLVHESESLDGVISTRRELEGIDTRLGALVEQCAAADSEHLERWNAFVAGNAPRLALDLRAGESCPVCGSTEHPHPAATDGGVIVSFEEVETARSEADRLRRDRSELEGRRSTLAGTLDAGSIEASIEELVARADALAVRLADSRTAASELERLTTEREAVSEEVADLTRDAGDRAERLARARTAHDKAVKDLADATATIGSLDRESIARRATDLELAQGCLDALSKARQACSVAEGAVGAARTRLDALVVQLEIDDIEGALARVLPIDEEKAAFDAVSDFEAKRNQAITESRTFDDVPDERPDPTTDREAATAAQEIVDDLGERLQTVRIRTEDISKSLDEIDKRTVANADALAHHRLLDGVASRCEGKGTARIGLETWVLAGELDRVLAAANIHLRRMTSSRYTLERTDDAGHGNRQAGLDIAVRDVFTGRTRPPGSLSGGEQFQTSLALALGLADVVSHGGIASGRRFEALFVDEGFGSLDPEALENAMRALEEIHQAGRMVGVITHVEAMKEVLPIGIRVERLADGRGSTLIVRPDD